MQFKINIFKNIKKLKIFDIFKSMEKETERILGNILYNNTYPKYIINSYKNNEILKKVFKKCSKNTNDNPGFPDKIYYDENKIIIFECKSLNINKAILEAKNYVLKMQKELIKNCEIYACGFVSETNYKIFEYNNENFIEIEKTIIELIKIKIKIKKDINKQIHDIHNFIRNNTKISNEDKSIFIGGILIALKNNNFKNYILNCDENNLSISIINILQEFNINIDYVYKSLNNENLLNITKMILDVIDNNDDIDLLNNFYNEFIKYQNTDSRSLGIVLTPQYIVKIMIELLNLSNDDIFLDLCTGTGSFLCEALKYNPKLIIGCEYQKKLFQLLCINNILRKNKFICINNDCFKVSLNEYKITKSAINPPYGNKDTTELDFVLHQLNNLEEFGLYNVIMPYSCIDSKKNYQKREKILLKSKIKIIIKCNKDLFYPTAGIGCYIILFEKNQKGHDYDNDLIKYIDYTNDGYEIKNNNRIKTKNVDIKDCYNVFFKLEKNKGLEILNNKIINFELYLEDLKLLELEQEYLQKKMEIKNYKNYQKNIKFDKIKDFKIVELFDILSKPEKKYDKIKNLVPYVCAKNNNNGIKYYKESNENTFYGNKIIIITGGDGAAGLAYYLESDFNVTSSVKVLKPKWNFLNKKNGLIFAKLLSNYKKIYSRSFQWSLERIKNDIISLPVKENNEINFELLNDF